MVARSAKGNWASGKHLLFDYRFMHFANNRCRNDEYEIVWVCDAGCICNWGKDDEASVTRNLLI